LLQIASGWDFREMLEFRDATAKAFGLDLLVHTNEEGERAGVRPWTHGAAYSDIMLTQALRQALDKYGFDAAFGGGRRS
jgi:sulfate adenylyltransferase subunit 2